MASQAQDLLVGTRVKDTAEKQLRIKESPPWRLWLLNIWIDLRDKEQAQHKVLQRIIWIIFFFLYSNDRGLFVSQIWGPEATSPGLGRCWMMPSRAQDPLLLWCHPHIVAILRVLGWLLPLRTSHWYSRKQEGNRIVHERPQQLSFSFCQGSEILPRSCNQNILLEFHQLEWCQKTSSGQKGDREMMERDFGLVSYSVCHTQKGPS